MDYTVDPDELRTMVRGLEAVRAAIAALGDGFGAAEPPADLAVVGSALVADALREVGDNWSKARARIGAEVEGGADALAAAARSYSGVESGLVAALGS